MRPTDAAALDAILTAAGSPLAGQGTTFVSAGVQAGIDPRFLVAIAAQETMLETYEPAQPIHNPFGLGPGLPFGSDAAAISTAANTLASDYLTQGLTTVTQIAAKWAPAGASNDPAGLNLSWPSDVSQYYQTLGGNPSLPVTLVDQTGDCGSTAALAAPALITVNPLGGVKAKLIQGPAQPGGTHDPEFNLLHGSYNWQSIWAVDLGVPIGTPVYAAFSGKIITVHSGQTGRFAGIAVGLDSGRGLAAYYAHLSAVDVTPGETIVAGERIGATGEADGVDHLHFALGRSYSDGSPSNGVNPLPFLAHAASTAEAAEVRLADATALATGSGTPIVTVWGGNAPISLGAGPAGGNDPTTGQPATISPFASRRAGPIPAAAMREGDGLLGWVGECIRGQRRRLRTGHPSGRHPRRARRGDRILDRHAELWAYRLWAARQVQPVDRGRCHSHRGRAARHFCRVIGLQLAERPGAGQPVAALDRRAALQLGD
jgi:murein DD-endopeptidase MepM/ murein hydrolase activator NlpD